MKNKIKNLSLYKAAFFLKNNNYFLIFIIMITLLNHLKYKIGTMEGNISFLVFPIWVVYIITLGMAINAVWLKLENKKINFYSVKKYKKSLFLIITFVLETLKYITISQSFLTVFVVMFLNNYVLQILIKKPKIRWNKQTKLFLIEGVVLTVISVILLNIGEINFISKIICTVLYYIIITTAFAINYKNINGITI